jgi:hypothetical protein
MGKTGHIYIYIYILGWNARGWHHWHIMLYHPADKSAVAKHSINLGHHIQFQDTDILVMKSRHMEYIIGEVTVIELHPNNMNREGFS